MEDITDKDYLHSKRVCKYFKIRNVGDYHDLHVQSDKLLLADVFENFQSMSPGLAWQVAFKKTKVKLDLLTDVSTINSRKRYQRWNMSHYSLICES